KLVHGFVNALNVELGDKELLHIRGFFSNAIQDGMGQARPVNAICFWWNTFWKSQKVSSVFNHIMGDCLRCASGIDSHVIMILTIGEHLTVDKPGRVFSGLEDGSSGAIGKKRRDFVIVHIEV